jgi:hypothetical protein
MIVNERKMRGSTWVNSKHLMSQARSSLHQGNLSVTSFGVGVFGHARRPLLGASRCSVGRIDEFENHERRFAEDRLARACEGWLLGEIRRTGGLVTISIQ